MGASLAVFWAFQTVTYAKTSLEIQQGGEKYASQNFLRWHTFCGYMEYSSKLIGMRVLGLLPLRGMQE